MKYFAVITLFFSLLLSVSSCKRRINNVHEQFVMDWLGEKIKFPHSPVFLFNGCDTVRNYGLGAKFKILNYVDSTGCTSCKLRLNEWKEFLSDLDSSIVSLHYYTNAKSNRTIINAIKESSFCYPICFDSVDSINILNKFSHLYEGITLLLDEKDKVIVAGSPILYPEIRKLYLKKIMGSSVPVTRNTTFIAMYPEHIDFGEVSLGEYFSKDVLIYNQGNNLLYIDMVSSSCGCIKAIKPEKPIAPGDSDVLTISFRANEKGYIRKTIEIYSNSGNPTRVSFNAFVR